MAQHCTAGSLKASRRSLSAKESRKHALGSDSDASALPRYPIMQLAGRPAKASQSSSACHAATFSGACRGRAEWTGALDFFPAPGALARPDHTLSACFALLGTPAAAALPYGLRDSPVTSSCPLRALSLGKWRELLRGTSRNLKRGCRSKGTLALDSDGTMQPGKV